MRRYAIIMTAIYIYFIAFPYKEIHLYTYQSYRDQQCKAGIWMDADYRCELIKPPKSRLYVLGTTSPTSKVAEWDQY